LKTLQISVIFCLFFISCNDKVKQEKEIFSIDQIKIPSIKKNKKDTKFKLINGVLFYDDTSFSGTVNEFYNEGILKSTSEYYQGKRQGKFFGFYPNKEKWFQRFYVNGLKVKTHKGWFQNGQQMFEYQFDGKGVYSGSVKDWHFNGQLARFFNFENGKETGSQKMWKVNGKIRANFFTIKGERHGLIGLKNCVSVITKER
jgi:antitoxin component YwqK of YwqJK toxin-antitoxin module